MVYCCVPICKEQQGKVKGLSFHEFPVDPDLRSKWLKAISRKDFVPNSNSGSSRVCGKHFTPNDFWQTLKKKRLKPNAVPSVFDGYPKYMQRSSPVKRKRNKMENSDSSQAPSKKLCAPAIDQIESVSPENISILERNEEVALLKLKIKRLHTQLWNQNKSLQNLQEKFDSARQELKNITNSAFLKSARKIFNDSSNSPRAQFLHDSILNYSSKKPKWTESSIRECILFHHVSPRGYLHAKKRLMKLPCKNTLKQYTGSIATQEGVNNLIKERLTQELLLLNESEKFASLIIDEMAIQPKCLYDKGLDMVFGFSGAKKKVLANRLLCFVINGLSTNYQIPCAYFFTKNLSGKKLFSLTSKVISEVENCGFLIVRVVTDNHKSNALMFRKFSQGKIKPVIPHPCDDKRLLFLSFDPSHIIKNLRNQFLEKQMCGKENFITGDYVKKIYEMQKNETENMYIQIIWKR